MNKCEGYDSNNRFLSEGAMIDNVRKNYENMDDVSVDDQPIKETLKKQETKKVHQKFQKRKGKKIMSKFEDLLEEAYSDKSYTFVQDLENEGINSVKTIACRK